MEPPLEQDASSTDDAGTTEVAGPVMMDAVVALDTADADDGFEPRPTERRMSVGPGHVCVVTSSRGVRCWGANVDHLLGAETTKICERKPYIPMPCSPTPVSPDGLGEVAEVDVAPHSCARRADGTVLCWGPAGRGGYGVHWTTVEKCPDRFCAPKPILIPGTGSVAQLAVGLDFTCLRLIDGTVRCSGENRAGQLGTITGEMCGIPGEKCSTKFVAIPDFDRVRVLRAAGGTCAVREDDTLWCWGPMLSDDPADRCDSGIPCRRSPTRITSLSGVFDIAMGSATCALTRTGRLWCFGWNENGELGRPSTDKCWDRPCSKTPLLLDLRHVQQVVSGNAHTCARLDDGTVRCWGSNSMGQLGIGPTASAMTPTEVAGLTNVVEIDTSYDTTCARTADGDVWCWGDNAWGQVGDGTTTDRNRPTRALVSPL